MEFKPGMIMNQIILADEINRYLLKLNPVSEVMEEKQVTVDGTTYPLPTPALLWQHKTLWNI